MLEFCGQESCTIDSAGRVKVAAGLLRDFQRHTDSDVVLYCLPERAIGIYPPKTWQEIRQAETANLGTTGRSMLARRQMRRFGAMSTGATLTNQGRLTIPPLFREFAQLVPGEPAMIVGCEIGIELWSMDRWKMEMGLLQEHAESKGELEMHADLRGDINQ